MRGTYIKAVALLLILLVLPYQPFVLIASAGYEDKLESMADRFEIAALFLYRGPAYETYGQRYDPRIYIMDDEGRGVHINYSEYLERALRGDIKFRFRIENAKEVGVISLSYDIPPIFLAGGSYSSKHYESSIFSGSAVDNGTHRLVYSFNVQYTARKHVFFDKPQHLYSVVRLGNNSKLVVPKGENVIFMLVPKRVEGEFSVDPVFFMLETFFLKDPHSWSCFNLGVSEAAKRALPADDPLSRLLQLTWTVEGGIGRLAYTELREIEVVAPSYASIEGNHYDNVGWRIKPQSVIPVTANESKTTVFAPASYPAPSVVNYLDPIDEVCSGHGARAIASKLSAMFIISPDVYSGTGEVRLLISNARGVPLATYRVTVEVGEERFKGIERELSGAYSDHMEHAYALKTSKVTHTSIHRLTVEKIGYDAFGTLRLAVRHSGIQIDTFTLERYYSTKDILWYGSEETESFMFSGLGEAHIGGWLPNPPPPGSVIYVSEMRYEVKHRIYEAKSHTEWLDTDSFGGCYIELVKPLDPNSYEIKKPYFDVESFCEEALRFPDVESTTQALTLVDTYTYEGRGNFTIGALVQLSPVGALALTRNTWSTYGYSFETQYEVETRDVYDNTLTSPTFDVEIALCYTVLSKDIGLVRVCSDDRPINVTGYMVAHKSIKKDQVVTKSERWSGGKILYVYLPETLTPETPIVEISERPALVVWLERDSAYPGESIKAYLSRYGGKGNVTVTVSATLSVSEETEIELNVTSREIKIGPADTGSVKIEIPTVERIQNITGANLTGRPMMLRVEAVDEEGASSSAFALVYGAGVYIVLSFVDIGLPLPDNPWDENVLDYISRNFYSYDVERPLRGGDYSLLVKVIDKSTGEEVYSERVTGDKLVISPTTLSKETGKEYIVAYELKIGNYYDAPIVVNDSGIDIVVTEEMLKSTQEVVKLEYNIPVPCTLMRKYFEYAQILSGNDDRFAEKLPDQYMVYQLLKSFRDMVSSAPVSAQLRDAKDMVLGVLDMLERIGWKSVYLRPIVLFPTSWGEASITTELSRLGTGISLRYPLYNLTRDAVALDPMNYWGKLSKLIILQAQMIRSYSFVYKEVLLLSQIVAMAITVESIEGRFTDVKLWNRGNILQNVMGKEWFGKEATKWLKAGKSTTILMDGDVLGLIGGLSGFIFGPAFRGVIERASSSDALALTSKIIQFLLSLPVGELPAEVSKEVVYQFLTLIIAQVLMGTYNMWLQHIALSEVMISPYPSGPLDTFVAILKGTGIAMYYSDVSFESIASKLSPGAKRPEERWHIREDGKGVIYSVYLARDYEAMFYAAANTYLQAEVITKTLLSIVKELDSVVEAVREKGIEVPGGKSKRLVEVFIGERGYGRTFSYELLGSQRLVKLKDVVNKMYLAVASATLADGLVKAVWIPSFNNMLKRGDQPAYATTAFVTAMQALLPAVTFAATARVPVGKLSASDMEWRGEQAYVYVRFDAPPSAYGTGRAWSFASEGDDISGEIKRLRAEAESFMRSFRGMVDRCQYNLDELSRLMEVLDAVDLTMRKAMARSSDEEVKANITLLTLRYLDDYYDFAEMVRFLLMYPSTRPIGPMLELIVSRAEAVLEDIREAESTITSAAGRLNARPNYPIPVVRDFDIDTTGLWREGIIRITVHNLGGSEANVSLEILGTELYGPSRTGYVTVSGGGRHTFTLNVNIPGGLREDIVFTLAIMLGETVVDYVIFRAYYTYGESMFNTVQAEGIEAISDGNVVISKEGLRLDKVSILHVLLPGGSSYVVKLNGTQIRSGEIWAKDKVIVGVSFDEPVSGILTYEPVRAQTSKTSGKGEARPSEWLTIHSPKEYDVSVTIYESSPVGYAAPVGIQLIKTFAIDVLRADAGYVTVRLSLEKLGVTDPSRVRILKFDVTIDAYREVKSFVIDRDRKEIVLNVSQGDPLFAIGLGEPRPTVGEGAPTKTEKPQTTPQPTFGGGIANVALLLIPVIAVLALSAIIIKRKQRGSALAR